MTKVVKRQTVAQKNRSAAKKAAPAKKAAAKMAEAYEDFLVRLKLVKDTAEEAKVIDSVLKPLKAQALADMFTFVEPDADGKRTLEAVVDGVRVKATVVESSGGLEFDEDGIRQEYGEEVWQTITKPVFDPIAFHQAIEDGTIPREDLPKFVTDTKKAPHVRIS